MASEMTPVDMRDVRMLAQKLYGQCRDSPSIYKTLAPGVRRLRNILEEVEETVAEDRTTDRAVELKVIERVCHCKLILQDLDLTLQSYRCSTYKWQDVKPETIANFKSEFEDSTDSLSAAFDVLTNTGEIELRLDTTASAVAESLRIQSASSSSYSSRHGRKSSLASSSVPLSHASPADGLSVQSEQDNAKTPSEEKEVYDMARAYLSSTSRPTPPSAVVDAPEWRTPFASLDPLSVDIDSASTLLLLQVPEDVSTSARRRSSVSSIESSIFVDAKAVQSPPLGVSNLAEEVDTFTSSSSTTTATPENDSRLVANAIIDSADESAHSVASFSPGTLHDHSASHIAPQETPLNRMTGDGDVKLGADIHDETHQAEQSVIPLGIIPRPQDQVSLVLENTVPDTSLSVPVDGEVSEPSQETSLTLERSLGSDVQTKRPLPTQPTENQPLDDAIPLPNVTSLDAPDTPGHADFAASAPATTTKDCPSPPQPSRMPPPPPPTRSHSNKPRRGPPPPPPPPKGRYRIMNPSPPSRSASNATEDFDPTVQTYSPTLLTAVTARHTRAKSFDIPKIQIEPDTRRDQPSENGQDTVADSQKVPPRIPRRPIGYSKTRSMSEMRPAVSDIPIVIQPPVADVAGLEVDNNLHSRRSDAALAPRKSADEALYGPVDATNTSTHLNASVQRLRSTSAPQITQIIEREPAESPRPPNLDPAPVVREFYSGQVSEVTIPGQSVNLDAERVERLCQCWNAEQWQQADAYLEGHLESLIEKDDIQAARRVRHLLGVSASFRGLWQRAIAFFISVLNIPVKNIESLDQGDFAAFYWLGDTYSILNRRTEAVLAYSLAEHIHAIQNNPHLGVQNVLRADQEAVQLGIAKKDLVLDWSRATAEGSDPSKNTILDPKIITEQAANDALQKEPRVAYTSKVHLKPEYDRATLLYHFDQSSVSMTQYLGLKISSDSLSDISPWPVPYDPYFSMANVVRGRLISRECDLRDMFRKNPGMKVARASPLRPSMLECFTCNHLDWLIVNIRESLMLNDMEWSEIADPEGVRFMVWFKANVSRFSTAHCFTISLFKQSMRSGYAVDICPDGMRSIRVVTQSPLYANGVYYTNQDRVKKLIKDHLTQAYKEFVKCGKKYYPDAAIDTSSDLMRNRASMSFDLAPPLPQRPESQVLRRRSETPMHASRHGVSAL